jgi:hypothetical protein
MAARNLLPVLEDVYVVGAPTAASHNIGTLGRDHAEFEINLASIPLAVGGIRHRLVR